MRIPPYKKIIYGVLDFFKKYGLTILAVVLLIFIWQLAVDGFHIKKYVLPSPKLVFNSLFSSFRFNIDTPILH